MDQPRFIPPTFFESEKHLAGVINGDIIEDINVTDFPVTYAVYEQLLKSFNEHGYNIQQNLPKVLLAFNPDFNLPKKISNLTRRVERDIANKSDSDSWKHTTSVRYGKT
jgi:hypothetical protein